MKITRRNILKTISISPLMMNMAIAQEVQEIAVPVTSHIPEQIEFSKIIPPMLNKGDKIAIIAPAGPSNIGEVSKMVSKMKEIGINCELGKTVTNSNKKSYSTYLSADDATRAEEFMHYINRADIKGIFCARGGYGIMRILDKLNFEQIKANPKIVIGFSDITALLIAITQKSNIVTYHGPVASSDVNQFSIDYLLPLIFKPYFQREIIYKSDTIKAVRSGNSEGVLMGGNLTMITSLLGTPYELNTDGAILFIEETHEEPYKIDRLLTQLKLSGKFDKCNGIIVGNFDYMNMRRKNSYTGFSATSLEIFNDIFKSSKYPVLYGFPFGHLKNKMTLPLGMQASISDSKKELIINYTNHL